MPGFWDVPSPFPARSPEPIGPVEVPLDWQERQAASRAAEVSPTRNFGAPVTVGAKPMSMADIPTSQLVEMERSGQLGALLESGALVDYSAPPRAEADPRVVRLPSVELAVPAGATGPAVAALRAREGGGGSYAPPVPPEFAPAYGAYGGFGEDYGERVAAAERRGMPGTDERAEALALALEDPNAAAPEVLTPEQAARARAAYNTVPGMQEQQFWVGQRGARERAAIEKSQLRVEEEANKRYAEERARADAEARRMEAQQARYTETFQREQAQREAQLSRAAEDLATTKVDPTAVWHKKGAASSIFSILGVALGGFAEGYSGGAVKNRALEMLNAEIDRDIDAQKSAFANKREALGQMRTVYGMARQRFGDDNMARQFAKAQMLEHSKNSALAIASDAKNVTIRNQARLAAQQLDEASKSNMLQLHILQRQASEDAARRAMWGGIGVGVKTAKPEDIARHVPELGGFAADPATRTKIIDTMSASKTLRDALSEMKRLRLEGSTGNPLSEDQARYDALQGTAVAAKNVLEAQGAISHGDAERVEQGIPKSGFWSLDAKAAAAIDVMSAMVSKKERDFINSQTIIPADFSPAAPLPGGGFGPQYRINPAAGRKAPLRVQTAADKLRAEGR